MPCSTVPCALIPETLCPKLMCTEPLCPYPLSLCALSPCALSPALRLQEQEQSGSVGLSRAAIRARLFPTTAESDQGSSPLSRISGSGGPNSGPSPVGLRATLGPPPLRPSLYLPPEGGHGTGVYLLKASS